MSNNHRNHLYTREEVPEYFQELFIHSGYRYYRSTAWQCMRSVLGWHNETMNIWTHLAGAVYFAVQLGAILRWQHLEDLHFVALLVYSLSLCTYPLASSTAHVFNAMSLSARHICFILDYWALCFYAFMSAIAYHAYSFPDSFHQTVIGSLYAPGSVVVTVMAFAFACRSRFMQHSVMKKVVRFLSIAVPYLYDLTPMVFRFTDAETDDGSDFYHMRQFLFAFFASMFYCLHVPERILPGRFDICGHSHQIFHVMIMLGSRDQLAAILHDAQKHSGDVASGWALIYIGLVVTFFVCTTVIFIAHLRLLGDLGGNDKQTNGHRQTNGNASKKVL